MRDHLMLYNQSAAHSDDTIYSAASAGSLGKASVHRERSYAGNGHTTHMHAGDSSYAAAGGLRDHNNKGLGGSGHSTTPAKPVVHKPQHHRRSASLLSRFRQSAHSPSASPTSSEGSSSRDTTHTERTLAHSMSSSSMRRHAASQAGGKRGHIPSTLSQQHSQQLGHGVHESDPYQLDGPGVTGQPPDHALGPDSPGTAGQPHTSSRKRRSLRGDGNSSGGFISQLLRGPSRSRSPRHSEAEPQAIRHFVRSPGTPHSQRSAGSSTRSPASIDDAEAEASPGHFHVSQCHFMPVASQPLDHHSYVSANTAVSGMAQAGIYAIPAGDVHNGDHGPGDMYYAADECPPGSVAPAAADVVDYEPRQHPPHHGGPADGMGIYGHDGWYSEGDSVESMNPAHRLASSLPVYEPIDMARNVPLPPSEPRSGAYIRATQPILPDARMLAPMASLADAYGGGPGGHNELSNRELRFTIENHMLVEQHRYLIRDLGHARSAISALKQVVQTKEDRYEHYEMANMELVRRIALLESVLTPEQRQLLACMPYTSAQSDGQVSSTNLADSTHSFQAPPPQQQYMEYGADTSGSFPGSAESLAMPLPTTSIPTVTQQGSVPDVKGTTNRPLSGYATGYTFSGKPVHQLPRVFSGDYSSADVHAMENSVEALASAITAMPHDADSVDDIIARKVADGDAPGPTCDCEHAVPEGPPRTDESQQRRSGRTEPKRRSRFLSVLRKSGLASSLSASGDVPGAAKQKRRSVSLGNGGKAKQQQQSRVEDGGPASYQLGAQSAQFGRQRADSEESMAASCPTLIPGIPRAKPSQKTQRLSSVESVGSNGRYPSSLGLGPTSDNSRMSSLQGGNGGRKISQRFSLTAEPRRSTSAPSRPHTMRVTSRRSWISQFFGGGSSSSNNSLEFVEPPTCEERELDSASDDASDELAGGPKVQRRRVMTHSTDEISRFLDKLRFEEPPPRGGISNGALEDVVDVSGEDEERASRASLSVAEVRQQTLDALNGTTRSNSELPPGCDSDIDNEPKTEPSDTCTHEASVRDPAGSRWRSHDTSVATIKRLNRAKSASNAPATGLGVCTAPSRGAAPEFGTSGESIPTESVVSAAHTASESYGRRPQSWAQSTRDEASPHNSKRWAPAFWAPPPNARSPDEPESGGHPHSDDLCFYSPEGSLGVHSRRGSRGRSSSPWELVRLSDTHKSPLSSSPSPPALGFFEDLTVPDSDELSMATRRSLSLRNSFTQADPLPESDDLGEEVMERAAIEVPRPLQAELGQELGRRPSVPLQNIALTRLTSSVQSKRRSLLRQFTPSRVANKPGVSRNMADFTDQGELEKTESSEGAADSPPAVSPQHLEPNLTSTSPRPSKRWWSSMLG